MLNSLRLTIIAIGIVLLMGVRAALSDSGPAESAAAKADPDGARKERAAALELATVWQAPPGEALVHHTGGFAKVLCSAVFISGLDPQDAIRNVGGFTAPFEHRDEVVETDIDFEAERVRLTLASGVVRTARRYGSQGCVTHPLDHDGVYFTPSTVVPRGPEPASTPWPMGDVSDGSENEGLDRDKVVQATAAIMQEEAKTLAFVATHRGQIIAEAYGAGVDMHTPLESWSMGKSLTGLLMGVLIQQGAYRLDQPAPIPQWQGDARAAIRITDLMRMSSGLRIATPMEPDPSGGYPDHLYLYTGDNAFEWAATRPQQWLPNQVGRYRNTDPVLANYLIRLAVEGRGEDYHAFPQRALFDKLGIRSLVMETDPHGNFLTQGYELGSARDWARLANLYLSDGVFHGERLLPEGYVDYAFELAPAWVADGQPVYGGAFLWRDLGLPLDLEYGAFAGAGGQFTIIVPSKNLVLVRLGKYTGMEASVAGLAEALPLLVEALPPETSTGGD